MKLDEIEAVGYLLTAYDEEDVYEDGDINYDVYEFHRDNYTQNDLNKCGLTQWDFCDCQALHTAEQMQEYAKECVRAALEILDNSILPIFEDDKRVVMQKIFEENTKND